MFNYNLGSNIVDLFIHTEALQSFKENTSLQNSGCEFFRREIACEFCAIETVKCKLLIVYLYRSAKSEINLFLHSHDSLFSYYAHHKYNNIRKSIVQAVSYFAVINTKYKLMGYYSFDTIM